MRPILASTLVLTALTATGVLVHQGGAAQPPPLFTDAERKALVEYWNAPGRYSIDVPPLTPARPGPWAVRLTPEGSTWFLTYQKAVAGARKIAPNQTVEAAATGPTAEWEPWVKAKLAYDRAHAQQLADSANGRTALVATVASNGPSASPPPPVPLPPHPGPAPTTLVAACGNPPPFLSAVTPLQYSVRFDDTEDPYTYTDNVKFPNERFGYYRFPRGVVSYGTRVGQLPESELSILFTEAGFSPSERKIFSAVSELEGGFETVQTYDTGYVSVGFIQFVTMQTGSGDQDICRVLETEKNENPEAFKQDFRQYGLDIQPDRTLTVVDPATGVELSGAPAVQKIIDDKRLTAIWQRAGRRSAAFKVAQIKIAKASYWPTDDVITVTLADGTKLTGTVGDVIKSEAGTAALLDRKINTGNTRPFCDVIARVMDAHNLKTLADAAKYERAIVADMKYRTDFLADKKLGQPPALPDDKKTQTASNDGFNLVAWFKDLFHR